MVLPQIISHVGICVGGVKLNNNNKLMQLCYQKELQHLGITTLGSLLPPICKRNFNSTSKNKNVGSYWSIQLA